KYPRARSSTRTKPDGFVLEGLTQMARVILGVTGGIAAYKVCELCRLLVKAGHEVTPVLTADAERFVTAHTFEALARREAPRELYPHLLEADLLVVAPLSANTLAKLAHGLADNVLTQTALAFPGRVLVAPAMNVRMWEHPATQANAAHGKRPKNADDWTVRLEPTQDILRGLGESRQNGQVLVGFAADTGSTGLDRARAKLETKRADLIVFNDVAQEGIGFDAADNEVVIVSRTGERTVTRARKEAIAA